MTDMTGMNKTTQYSTVFMEVFSLYVIYKCHDSTVFMEVFSLYVTYKCHDNR